MIHNFIKSFLASVVCLSAGHTFGGVYVGADAGMTNLSVKHRVTTIDGPGKTTASSNGIAYGAHAGYLYEVGSSKTIVGGELYAGMAVPTASLKFGADGASSDGDVKMKRSRSIGVAAVVGKMMNLNMMIYGKVGLERATFEGRYSFNATSVSRLAGTNLKKSVSYMSPVVGAGVAYKINEKIMVGAELQLANFFGKKKILSADGIQAEIEPSEKRLMGRASFAFG